MRARRKTRSSRMRDGGCEAGAMCCGVFQTCGQEGPDTSLQHAFATPNGGRWRVRFEPMVFHRQHGRAGPKCGTQHKEKRSLDLRPNKWPSRENIFFFLNTVSVPWLSAGIECWSAHSKDKYVFGACEGFFVFVFLDGDSVGGCPMIKSHVCPSGICP